MILREVTAAINNEPAVRAVKRVIKVRRLGFRYPVKTADRAIVFREMIRSVPLRIILVNFGFTCLIAYSSYGTDKLTAFKKLSSQRPYMHIDGSAFTFEIKSPDFLEKHIT